MRALSYRVLRASQAATAIALVPRKIRPGKSFSPPRPGLSLENRKLLTLARCRYVKSHAASVSKSVLEPLVFVNIGTRIQGPVGAKNVKTAPYKLGHKIGKDLAQAAVTEKEGLDVLSSFVCRCGMAVNGCPAFHLFCPHLQFPSWSGELALFLRALLNVEIWSFPLPVPLQRLQAKQGGFSKSFNRCVSFWSGRLVTC